MTGVKVEEAERERKGGDARHGIRGLAGDAIEMCVLRKTGEGTGIDAKGLH